MSKDFLLDDTGDLIINDSNGDLTMTNNEDSILAQRVQSLLNTNFGELDWNDSYGLNHIQIMANADDLNAVRQVLDNYLRDSLDGYSHITIDGSSFDNGTRSLKIIATVYMNNGQQIKTQMGGDN